MWLRIAAGSRRARNQSRRLSSRPRVYPSSHTMAILGSVRIINNAVTKADADTDQMCLDPRLRIPTPQGCCLIGPYRAARGHDCRSISRTAVTCRRPPVSAPHRLHSASRSTETNQGGFLAVRKRRTANAFAPDRLRQLGLLDLLIAAPLEEPDRVRRGEDGFDLELAGQFPASFNQPPANSQTLHVSATARHLISARSSQNTWSATQPTTRFS